MSLIFRVYLVQRVGGEGRDFNGGDGKGREEKGDILIKYMFDSKEGKWGILIKSMFGSQGEGRDFKINLLFYT